jgi:subtilase family serine protease
MTQLPGSLLPVLSHSTVQGVPSPNQAVYCTVSLKPRFPAELQAFVDSVSNPRSDTYRHWMTPAQVGQQFGASPSTVSAVVNYLRSKGLVITLQAPNNMAITAKGTVTQVQNAFATTLKNYSGPDPLGRPSNFLANSTPISVPTSWASTVVCVSGIENWAKPCPMSTQTLTPPLARGLYNEKPGYVLGFHGEGQTVGITNFDGFRLSNAPLFITAFGLPVPPGGAGSNISVVTVGGGSGNGNPGGEGDLDFQMVLGMAPLSRIIIYDGGGDEIALLAKEGSDNLADVITESYGFILNGPAAHNQHLAIEAQGQTIMNATGDSGTQIHDFPYPDADPEALGVGGTVATVDSNTGARISEVTWDGGGGGWTTSGFPFDKRPSWQVGPGIPQQPNARLQPDIALQAGGPGAFVIYWNGAQAAFDGTSCASPCFAGGLAALEGRLAAQNIPPRFGRINDLIYSQAGRSDAWFDITQGSNGILPDGQQSNAHAGWDFCCGWGCPNFDGLFNTFAQTVITTPYFPVNIAPFVGTYLAGDTASVATSDGIYYQLGSTAIPQLGQAAGASATFFVPQTAVAISIGLEANAGIAGGTNNVWLFNWSTGNYDLIGSSPINASGSAERITKVRPSDVGLYLGPGGEVDMIVRGHLPLRPFNNSVPNPFTYKIDRLQLLVR